MSRACALPGLSLWVPVQWGVIFTGPLAAAFLPQAHPARHVVAMEAPTPWARFRSGCLHGARQCPGLLPQSPPPTPLVARPHRRSRSDAYPCSVLPRRVPSAGGSLTQGAPEPAGPICRSGMHRTPVRCDRLPFRGRVLVVPARQVRFTPSEPPTPGWFYCGATCDVAFRSDGPLRPAQQRQGTLDWSKKACRRGWHGPCRST